MDTVIANPDTKKSENARKELKESIIGISDIFVEMPFFMSEEFTRRLVLSAYVLALATT